MLFTGRNFHAQVRVHARNLFLQRNYFHAVFESAKAYNKAVREKAKSTKDGQPLMLEVWGCDRGVLKITACRSDPTKRSGRGKVPFGRVDGRDSKPHVSRTCIGLAD